MKWLLLVTAMVLFSSCSTIKHAVGGAIGGGLTAAFIPEPAAVAAGAAVGVTVTELILPSASPTAIAGQVMAGGPVQGTTASAIHETGGLLKTVGYWWLILFVFLPLFRKNGRTWFKKLGEIHNTVSQKDIDARDEEQDVRLNTQDNRLAQVEDYIQNLKN